MPNPDAVNVLIAFSIGLWAMISKTPLKLGIKYLVERYVPETGIQGVSRDESERYIILAVVAVLATILITAVRSLDVTLITNNLSEEWRWLKDGELVSAASVINLVPKQYSWVYFVDLSLTVTFVTLGSSVTHRFVQWLTGNSLVADVLREWLMRRGLAVDAQDNGNQL